MNGESAMLPDGYRLAALREKVVLEWGEMKFTCDDCSSRHVCEFVFDPYNTDGDCLAEK